MSILIVGFIFFNYQNFLPDNKLRMDSKIIFRKHINLSDPSIRVDTSKKEMKQKEWMNRISNVA